ncbi:hypothetical protein [Paenacidovorax monticola]|uniref:Uncharacterized protein n=1 Tax=Paenacidovorax monticola TaxID=1926868 RepID=A0A7H0HHB1_9BURK|nr:hypothetical protein [Paenacidovorax monticola]QNP59927.1 hypothetical protein H9L24_02885 [Paenacidovorax monticola]
MSIVLSILIGTCALIVGCAMSPRCRDVVGGAVSSPGGAIGETLDNLTFSKGGKQNIRDTGLIGVSDEEIGRRLKDPSTTPEERKRLVKEQKARGNRNKDKDSRKDCQ